MGTFFQKGECRIVDIDIREFRQCAEEHLPGERFQVEGAVESVELFRGAQQHEGSERLLFGSESVSLVIKENHPVRSDFHRDDAGTAV